MSGGPHGESVCAVLAQGEILDEAHESVVQLADIFDYVTPCFPEKYRIFRVIFKEYHQHLSYMLDCIGACAEQLANSDILKAWSLTTRSHNDNPGRVLVP